MTMMMMMMVMMMKKRKTWFTLLLSLGIFDSFPSYVILLSFHRGQRFCVILCPLLAIFQKPDFPRQIIHK
jgi:hypothetical protein